MTTVTFPADGATHTLVIPANVFSLQVTMDGAGAQYAAGARIRATVPVTPGQTCIFMTGRLNAAAQPYGKGGVNGSGSSGGGGASAMWRDSIANGNLVAVAAGAGFQNTPGGAPNGVLGAMGATVGSGFRGGVPLYGGNGGPGGTVSQTITPGGAGETGTGGNYSGYGGGGGATGGGGGSQGQTGEFLKDGGGSLTVRSGGGNGGSGASYMAGAIPAGNVIGTFESAPTQNVDGAITVTYSAEPPTPPTILTPTTGADVDLDAGVTVTIESTLLDVDPQTSADLRWKATGDADWTVVTGAFPGMGTSYSFAAGTFTATVPVEVQVRAHDSFSQTTAWSTSTIFTPRNRPDPAMFLSPDLDGTVVDAARMATLAYVPSTAVEAQRVADANGFPDPGNILDPTAAVTVSGTDPWVFTGDPAVHSVGPEHLQVRYRTTESGTLWSDWSDLRVQMNLSPPPVPVVRLVALSDEASVQVGWVIGAPGTGESAADRVSVFRVDPSGTRLPVATGLAPTAGPVIDRRPGVGVADYRVVAYAASGAASESE